MNEDGTVDATSRLEMDAEQLSTLHPSGGFGTSISVIGDINGDGVVSFPDFLILSASFSHMVEAGTDGDLNGDGICDFADLRGSAACGGPAGHDLAHLDQRRRA